jgi:hypothetical protein
MAKYDDYAMTVCNDIPPSDLEILIMTFIKGAEVDMGSELDILALPRIVEFVRGDYKHLPLYAIASAIKKGSLGHYGNGRLTPRTINGWLSEMSNTMFQKSKGIADSLDMGKKWDGLEKYPVGSAICKKIDWFQSGKYHFSDWDAVPLKEVADRLKKGLEVYPEMYGIKAK